MEFKNEKNYKITFVVFNRLTYVYKFHYMREIVEEKSCIFPPEI